MFIDCCKTVFPLPKKKKNLKNKIKSCLRISIVTTENLVVIALDLFELFDDRQTKGI